MRRGRRWIALLPLVALPFWLIVRDRPPVDTSDPTDSRPQAEPATAQAADDVSVPPTAAAAREREERAAPPSDPRSSWSCDLRIVASDGLSPIAGAQVDLELQDGRFLHPRLRAFSDALGAVAVTDVVADRVIARIRANGHRPGLRVLEPDEGVVVVELGRHAGVISGVVRHARGPASGATVQFVAPDGDSFPVVECDASGAYRLDRLPVAVVGARLLARHAGFATSSNALAPLVGGEESRVDIELASGRSLRVTCKTVDGRAIEGARVSLRGAEHAEIATSDARGLATLTGLPCDDVQLVARADGFVERAIELARCAAPEDAWIETSTSVVLVAASRAVGTIVDQDGRPVAATLTFVAREAAPGADDWSDPRHARFVHEMDRPGAFALDGLIAGVGYRVVVEAPGFAPLEVAGDWRAARERELDLGTLRLERGRTLLARVVDGEGAPVADARVWVLARLADGAHGVFEEVARSADDGAAEIAGLPRSSVVVRAIAGEAIGESVVEAAATTAQVVVRPPIGWTLHGRCVDARGEPVGDVELVVDLTPSHAGDPWTRVGADAMGVFRVDDVKSPWCIVDAAPESPFATLEGPVQVGAFDGELALLVRVSRAIRGRIASPSEREARERVSLAWRARDGSAARQVELHADGSFELRAPAELDGELAIAAPAHRDRRLEVAAGRGALDVGAIHLEPCSTLTARCRTVDGKPVQGAWIEIALRGADADGLAVVAEAKTDVRGEAVFDAEVDGRYAVIASFGARSVTRELDSRAGDALAEIDGFEPPAWLRVRLVDARGVRVPGATLVLADARELREGHSDAEGRVDFGDVPLGRYHLRVFAADDTSPTSKELEIVRSERPFDLEVRLE